MSSWRVTFLSIGTSLPYHETDFNTATLVIQHRMLTFDFIETNVSINGRVIEQRACATRIQRNHWNLSHDCTPWRRFKDHSNASHVLHADLIPCVLYGETRMFKLPLLLLLRSFLPRISFNGVMASPFHVT